MTPSDQPVTPKPLRLFTERATAVAGAIGGPLATAYLIAKNFKSLGKGHAAKMTLIIGGAITAALFTALALLPPSVVEKIPPPLIPLVYGIVGYLLVKTLQQRDIDAHLEAGGKKGSWQVIVGAGLAGLVLSLGYIGLLVFLTPSSSGVFDGDRYELNKTGATIYYDKTTIPEADIKFVGSQVEAMGYFSGENPTPAAFRKEGGKYTVELIVDKENWEAAFVRHNTAELLRVLKTWHQDSEFQVRFVALDLMGQKTTKIFSAP